MKRQLKRQHRTLGAIVKIPLENGFHTYARILETRMAFYDARTKENLEINEIVEKSVLFEVIVENYTITEGYWLKIGKKLPLEEHLLVHKPFYTEDIFTGQHFIVKGIEQVKATKEEISGLECFVWWTHKDIEERLNDHYSNKKNKFVEDMKNGRPSSNLFQRAIQRKKELVIEKKQKESKKNYNYDSNKEHTIAYNIL